MKDKGWRLRLDKAKSDIAFLHEEKVLPERVDNPNAMRVIANDGTLQLNRKEAEWLRDALNELLATDEDW